MKIVQGLLGSIIVIWIGCQPTSNLARKVSNSTTSDTLQTSVAEIEPINRTAEDIEMEDATAMYDMNRAAQRKDRPIFIVFYSEWCTTCDWVERDIIAAPNVSSFLEANFVSFRVNGERGGGVDIANDLDIREYPTLVYITTEGQEYVRFLGMPNEHKIIQLGKKILKEERDIKKRKARKKKRKK